ncbi:MAG: CidA/LrgA family protein [Acidobacteriaceae bacterium]
MRGAKLSAIKTNQMHVAFQVLLLIGFWLLGEIVVRAIHLPIPGGIAGMFIVLGLLMSRKLDVTWLRLGSEWLLAEMLLFFIPAVLVVLDHREFLGIVGLKIFVVIVPGTILVMTITAFTVDIWQRLEHGAGGHHEVD